MPKLIVNSPSGEQKIEVISDTGSYFDKALIVWDERLHGILPDVVPLGKIKRDGKKLIELDEFIPEHLEFIEKVEVKRIQEVTEKAKKEATQQAIESDEILLQLKDLDSNGIDEWFKANGKTKSEDVLKFMVKALIFKGLVNG